MQEIIINGKPTPIHYGMRVFKNIAQQQQASVGEVIVAAQQIVESNLSVAVDGLSLLINASVTALNEGARRSNLETRYSEDDVVDMIDDDHTLLSRFLELLNEAVEVSSLGFMKGRTKPTNQRTPGE